MPGLLFPSAQGDPLKGCSIVCAVTDHFQREQSARVLETHAHNVFMAETGEQALTLCRERAPDILFTEVSLPDMDGLDLAARIREEFPDILIIVAADVDDPWEGSRAVEQGVDGVLLRPILPNILIHAMRKACLELATRATVREAQTTLRTILDAYPDFAVMIEDDRIVYANQAMCRFLGFSDFEALLAAGRDVSEFIISEDAAERPWFFAVLDDSIDHRPVVRIPPPGAPDAPFSFVATHKPFPMPDRHLITLTDVTELVQEKESLEDQASRDPLTGALNRRRFETMAVRVMQSCDVSAEPLSVVMFDVDYFKAVNDEYGHDAGDAVLRALVDAVADNIRPQDLLARWGGEEFLLMAPGVEPAAAAAMAERLRGLVAAMRVPGVNRPLTCSFGVTGRRASEPLDALIARVDGALYAAKAQGRNCVVIGDGTAEPS
jgi:diguanylate cyclase (GGDEF)-like protein